MSNITINVRPFSSNEEGYATGNVLAQWLREVVHLPSPPSLEKEFPGCMELEIAPKTPTDDLVLICEMMGENIPHEHLQLEVVEEVESRLFQQWLKAL